MEPTESRFPLKVQIASPCPMAWAEMEGDDLVRFCGQCQKNVYNLSGLTEDEARELVGASGDLCVTFFKRADGTVLTEDCPEGLALARRKLARRLTRAASAVLALGALAVMGVEAAEPPGGYDAQARALPVVGTLITWLSPPKPEECKPSPKRRSGESSTGRMNITNFASQSTAEP